MSVEDVWSGGRHAGIVGRTAVFKLSSPEKIQGLKGRLWGRSSGCKAQGDGLLQQPAGLRYYFGACLYRAALIPRLKIS